MADQQRETPPGARVARTTETGGNAPLPPTVAQGHARIARVALKWRDLTERRRAHLMELYESGRWKHYYTHDEYLNELRNAVAITQRWTKIALEAEEVAFSAMVELPQPKAAA